MTSCPQSQIPDPALLAAVAGADPVVVLTGHYGVGKIGRASCRERVSPPV